MLTNIIQKINSDYIAEAVRSPTLMEDMAAMEKYLAESYSGRVFIELLQNADDCGATDIFVQQFNNNLIFANNGRAFDENDIVSISRSGASKKERGSQIGYRGIGFKSASYLTEEILIYSNSTFFTFSKNECSKCLGKPKDKLPTVRIPFVVKDVNNELCQHILEVARFYTTIFVFKDAKADQFLNEVKNLSNGCFIFLRNICSCVVQMPNWKHEYKILRDTSDGYELLTFENEKKQQWLIIRDNDVALAMQLLNGKIVACESDESIYHCFLPTLDKTPYPFKINADFSTDPSRKHITLDSFTTDAIKKVAVLIYKTLEKTIEMQDSMFSNLFDMILSIGSFSPINQILNMSLEELIKKNLNFRCPDGVRKPLRSFKSLPDYFENSEKNVLRLRSTAISAESIDQSYYNIFPSISAFVEKYSDIKFTYKDISNALTEKCFVESLSPQMYARIFAFVVSSVKISKLIRGDTTFEKNMLIPTDKGVVGIKQIAAQNLIIAAEVKNAISERTSSTDLELFCKNIGISSERIKQERGIEERKEYISKNTSTTIALKRPIVSKWRSAEQQCLEIETFWGNKATDVSKQNMGYDIESVKPDGTKRFIEVKLISNPGSSFSLTNNEYTAAHQYGDNYFVCLMNQREHVVDVLYISNPLKNLTLEKKVRQWEWYCEEYSGEKFSVDLK